MNVFSDSLNVVQDPVSYWVFHVLVIGKINFIVEELVMVISRKGKGHPTNLWLDEKTEKNERKKIGT